MPPLLADFIHARLCKSKCEKFLIRPPDIDYVDKKNSRLIPVGSRREFPMHPKTIS